MTQITRRRYGGAIASLADAVTIDAKGITSHSDELAFVKDYLYCGSFVVSGGRNAFSVMRMSEHLAMCAATGKKLFAKYDTICHKPGKVLLYYPDCPSGIIASTIHSIETSNFIIKQLPAHAVLRESDADILVKEFESGVSSIIMRMADTYAGNIVRATEWLNKLGELYKTLIILEIEGDAKLKRRRDIPYAQFCCQTIDGVDNRLWRWTIRGKPDQFFLVGYIENDLVLATTPSKWAWLSMGEPLLALLYALGGRGNLNVCTQAIGYDYNMMKICLTSLVKHGYVEHRTDGYVSLTKFGRSYAATIFRAYERTVAECITHVNSCKPIVEDDSEKKISPPAL